jgi:hypothetical protein
MPEPNGNFLSQTEGFTPIIDVLAQEVGLITAAIYGVVWRYCQMKDGVCRASLETIAQRLGIKRKTVERHIKKLCERGYLKDLSPDVKNRPHIYADTGRAKITGLVQAQVIPSDEANGQTESLTSPEEGKTLSPTGKTLSPTRSDLESYPGKTLSPMSKVKDTTYETIEDSSLGAAEKIAAPSEPEPPLDFPESRAPEPPRNAEEHHRRTIAALQGHQDRLDGAPWLAWPNGSEFWKRQREEIRRVGYLVEQHTGLSPPTTDDKKTLDAFASGCDALLKECEGDFGLLASALEVGMARLLEERKNGGGIALKGPRSVLFMVSDYRAQKRRGDDKTPIPDRDADYYSR